MLRIAPTFVFHTNGQVELHTGDARWMENTIRSQWAFTGTPLRLVMRSRDVRKRRRDKETPRPKGRHAGRRRGAGRGEQESGGGGPRLAVGRVQS